MKKIASTIVRATDIALNDNLFGGTLLRWLDEYGALYTYENLHHTFITAWMGETYFTKTAHIGDLIRFYAHDLKFYRSYVQFRLRAVVVGNPDKEIINTEMRFVPIDRDTGKIIRMNPFLFEREEFEKYARQKIEVDTTNLEIPGRYGDQGLYKKTFISNLYKSVYGDTSKAIAQFQKDYCKCLPPSTMTSVISFMSEEGGKK